MTKQKMIETIQIMEREADKVLNDLFKSGVDCSTELYKQNLYKWETIHQLMQALEIKTN